MPTRLLNSVSLSDRESRVVSRAQPANLESGDAFAMVCKSRSESLMPIS